MDRKRKQPSDGWFVYKAVHRYIDGKGQACKPFLLPQKDTDFYFRFMKSYNIPEFITGEVKRQGRALAVKAKEDKGVDVRFK